MYNSPCIVHCLHNVWLEQRMYHECMLLPQINDPTGNSHIERLGSNGLRDSQVTSQLYRRTDSTNEMLALVKNAGADKVRPLWLNSSNHFSACIYVVISRIALFEIIQLRVPLIRKDYSLLGIIYKVFITVNCGCQLFTFLLATYSRRCRDMIIIQGRPSCLKSGK